MNVLSWNYGGLGNPCTILDIFIILSYPRLVHMKGFPTWRLIGFAHNYKDIFIILSYSRLL